MPALYADIPYFTPKYDAVGSRARGERMRGEVLNSVLRLIGIILIANLV